MPRTLTLEQREDIRRFHAFRSFCEQLIENTETTPLERTIVKNRKILKYFTVRRRSVGKLQLRYTAPPLVEETTSLEDSLLANSDALQAEVKLLCRWSDDEDWSTLDTLRAWSELTHPWDYVDGLLADLESRLSEAPYRDRAGLEATFKLVDACTHPSTHATWQQGAPNFYPRTVTLQTVADAVVAQPLGQTLYDTGCFLLCPVTLVQDLDAVEEAVFWSRFGQRVTGGITPVTNPGGVEPGQWNKVVLYALLPAIQTTFRDEAWGILRHASTDHSGAILPPDIPPTARYEPDPSEQAADAYDQRRAFRRAYYGDADESITAYPTQHNHSIRHRLAKGISHIVPTAAMVELLLALVIIPCMAILLIVHVGEALSCSCQMIAMRCRDPRASSTSQYKQLTQQLKSNGAFMLLSVPILLCFLVLVIVGLCNACLHCLRHLTHNLRALDTLMEKQRPLLAASTVLLISSSLALLVGLIMPSPLPIFKAWQSLLLHLPGSPTLPHLTLMTLGIYLVVRRLLMTSLLHGAIVICHPRRKHQTHASLSLPMFANLLFTALAACVMLMLLAPLHHALHLTVLPAGLQVLATLGACLILEASLYLVFQAVMATQQPPVLLYNPEIDPYGSTFRPISQIHTAAISRSITSRGYKAAIDQIDSFESWVAPT